MSLPVGHRCMAVTGYSPIRMLKGRRLRIAEISPLWDSTDESLRTKGSSELSHPPPAIYGGTSDVRRRNVGSTRWKNINEADI